MKTRYAFLDVYRGLIVLLMIEGHAVREFLYPALQTSGAFQFHEFIHGVTGPGFLFGAGITFGISVQNRWGEFLSLTSVSFRRFRKIVLLLLLGYALHLPFLSLHKMLHASTQEQLLRLYSFDVLQCIGFTLLIVHLGIFIVRKQHWFPGVLPIATTVVLIASPFLWMADLSSFPSAVSTAFQGTLGSVYPLFPYSAFLFAGAFASYEFMKFAESGRESIFVKRLALGGIALTAGGAVLLAATNESARGPEFWNSDPTVMVVKLGSLFLLVSGAWTLEKVLGSFRGSKSLQWIILLGIESLFVYVLHLVLLYGSVLNADSHLSALWKGRFDWVYALLISIAFTAFLAVTAWMWNKVKTSHPAVFRMIVWWMAAVFGYEFLTRPY